MRVALITTSYPLHEKSTAGVFVHRLATALSLHVGVTVLTPQSWCDPPPHGETPVVRTFRYAPRRYQRLAHSAGGIPVALRRSRWAWLLLPFFLLALFVSALRTARANDLIHANWCAVGAIAGIAGRLVKKPVVTTLRGEDVNRLDKSRIDRALMRITYYTNHRLIAVSEGIRTHLLNVMPEAGKHVVVIPNGVDRTFFDLPPLTPNHHSSIVRITTIGSLIPRKSVATILDALARVGNANFVLEVIGEGPEQSALEARAEALGILDCVEFRGGLAPGHVIRALSTSDIFVMASRSEGRPNALLEAMAAARAPVVPAISGIVELIQPERNGMLYEPGDVAGLAAALQYLISKPELARQLGLAARQRLQELELTWERTAKEYVRIYQHSLAKS